MHFDILTGHPSLFLGPMDASILGKAKEKELFSYSLHNLHDYSGNKWGRIDDTPYGGGAGMVIKCEPVFRAYEMLTKVRDYDEVIYMAADGDLLSQSTSNRISLMDNVLIICGHYKGIDQRIRDSIITKEISIGQYVLTGGELPAMVLIDSVVRLIPGAIGDSESALTDSFMDGGLEPPIYTKPKEFRGMSVPDILLSGNHAAIEKWKEQVSEIKTKEKANDK
ncbi:MAG: tRNA (guanosine(37)-N1)-methyltransferase TrmD [Candidatus Kapaibacteriales bacterium]